jgi:mono/diheme cytochrome c family protein
MPPFNGLSDRQVAAVATYIRNSWGNEFGIVTEAQIAAYR